MLEIKENYVFANNNLIGYIKFENGKWKIDVIDANFPIRHIESDNRDYVINTILSESYRYYD